MNKRALNLLIFTIGVVMLLLRPYIIYQLTTQRALAGNPLKSYSLLQRLVKKKEEHHDVQEIAAVQTNRAKFVFQIPERLIGFFYSCVLLHTASCTSINSILQTNNLFNLPAQHHRYRLLSCFQI
jgi:hypothetical protein